MGARVTASIVVIAVAGAAIVIGARQTRDPGGPSAPIIAPSGTGVLSGTVTTGAVAPRPVRRAVVRLIGAAGTSARLVGTDDEGRFVFDALPAGAFSLSATKTGYVPAFYGAKRPGRGPGVPIAIADGQRVAVTLAILPGGVITGTITDPHGNPAPAIPVLAVDLHPIGANAGTPARATTDDRGVYRIFGLAPGDYAVSAWPPSLISSLSGAPMTDILGVTDGEAQWARSMSASAPFVGAGMGATPPPSGRPVTYAPVYYPGTTDANAAGKVSVAAGEEQANIGFSLRIVTTVRIAGTLVDQNGQAVTSASASLYPRRSGEPSVTDVLISSGALVLPRAVVSAPAFSIAGVTPGDYTLVARTGSSSRAAAAAAAAQAPLWSVTDLTVDGRDQTDLVLRLQPGMKVSGSIVFERSSLPQPSDLSGLDISMVATASLVGAPATPRAVVDPGGTFRFASVVPGTYALKVTPPGAAGARWTMKSAVLNSRDVADVPLDVKPGEDVAGLVITFTDRAAEISGALVDAGGRPVTKYSIVVFTVDRTQWLPNARRIRAATPATDGTFRVASLPAGDYAIAAAEDLEAADLADPAFLSQLLASAYRLTLAEGERKTQNLRTAP